MSILKGENFGIYSICFFLQECTQTPLVKIEGKKELNLIIIEGVKKEETSREVD